MTTIPKDVDPEQVAAVTPSGAPVKERVTRVEAGRSLFQKLEAADSTDAQRRARLKGQIDGNPPYDPNRLKELGLGNMTNVNFLEMRAALDAKASAYYELFFEVPRLIECNFRGEVDQRQPMVDFGDVVAEEFTRMVFAWNGFLPAMDRARRESDAYGLGLMLFQDSWDWRPKAYARGAFLPDQNASTDVEELQAFGLRDTLALSKLMTIAEMDAKVAKDEGWNQTVVRKVLVSVFNEGQSQNKNEHAVSDWESWQQKIRNNDASVQIKALETVKVCHLVIAESDSGISHYIFTPNSLDAEGDDFMFRKARQYERVSQLLWWIPFNNGDGYIRSCRGMASMMESHCDLSNRFLGRTFDAGFLSAGIMIQPKTATDLAKLQLIRSGPLTVIPPEVNAIQSSTFAPPIAQLVQLRDLSSSVMKNNTGIYRQYPEMFSERQPNKTAYQVAQETSKEARVEKSNVTYDYEQIEKLYREMFRRVTSKDYIEFSVELPGQAAAKKFVERCEKRGVRRALLFNADNWEVFATRAIGLGSLGVKLDITGQILANRGLYDEVGQINACREWLAVRVGYQNVDKFKSLINRDKIPSNEQSIATLENNDFAEGSGVPVGSDQMHSTHFLVHVEPMLQVIQAVQQAGPEGQGLNLQKALMILQTTLPHAMQHLQYLEGDPTRADTVKQGVKLLKMAADTAGMLQKQIVAQQKVQQKQDAQNQQVLQNAASAKDQLEAQVALAKINSDAAIERAKQESLNQARAVKTQDQIAINNKRADAQIQIAAKTAEAEIQMAQDKLQGMLAMSEARVRPPGTA